MTYTNEAAGSILSTAQQTVCNDRSQLHGDTRESFEVIAAFWTTYLSARNKKVVGVTSGDVAEMMSLLKKTRHIFGASNEENYIDDAGYSAIAGMLTGIKIAKEVVDNSEDHRVITPKNQYTATEGGIRRAGIKAVGDAI